MVCQACQTVLLRQGELVFDSWRRHDSIVVHHKSVEGLRRAAEVDKCSICYGLWTKLSPEAQELVTSHDDDLKDETRSLYHRIATHASVCIAEDEFEWQTSKTSFIATQFRHSIRHIYKEDGPWQLYITLSKSLVGLIGGETISSIYDLYPEKGEQDIPNLQLVIADLLALGKTLPPLGDLSSASTAFPDTKAMAYQWLQQCSSNHRACNEDSSRGSWNPTRLIDVGSAPNENLKLINTSSCTQALTYVTLSHRWGQVDVPMLQKDSESRLERSIAIHDLPSTFQQAITVVRDLQHRYLWIDSLCIRQDRDDLSDWLHEAALMHKIYGHGHFNISATGALDGSEGLFRQRDHTAKGFEKVFLQVEGLNGGPTPCIAFHSSFWADNITMAPLNLRGWVLQERILSKRVLHFGRTQLLWECKELEAAETFPNGTSYDGSQPVGIKCLEPGIAGPLNTNTTEAERDPKFWPYDLWTGIATTYSKCSLTNPEDKLLAIMGLAKHVNGLIKDTYVAGMWRTYLASELAWRIHTSRRTRPSQSETYTAPTWSWLSQDGAVSCNSASDKGIRVAIKAVELDYATNDPCGPLRGGRLYLEGILRRLRVHRKPGWDSLGTGAWTLTLPDFPPLSDNGSFEDLVRLDIVPENFDAENEDDSLFCMELVDDVEWWATLDVLLLKCEDRAKGIFSRVGLSSIHDARKKLLADRKRYPELPCVSWDAKQKLHTICVI